MTFEAMNFVYHWLADEAEDDHHPMPTQVSMLVLCFVWLFLMVATSPLWLTVDMIAAIVVPKRSKA